MGDLENTVTAELAQAVREKREEQGLSQAELAELVGTTQAKISQIEQGKANPTLNLVARLAESLGLQMMVVGKQLLPHLKEGLNQLEATVDALSKNENIKTAVSQLKDFFGRKK